MAHSVTVQMPPAGPVIGKMTCKIIDGTLWLFDDQGRRLDMVRSIQVNQAHDDVTTATVVLLVDMERGEPDGK